MQRFIPQCSDKKNTSTTHLFYCFLSNNLISKAGDVVEVKLDSSETGTERRIRSKSHSILNNTSHFYLQTAGQSATEGQKVPVVLYLFMYFILFIFSVFFQDSYVCKYFCTLL